MILKIVLIYILAYFYMMIITAAHVMFNWKILHYKGYESVNHLINNGTRVEAYKKTIPYQPIYNIVVFSLLSINNFNNQPLNVLILVGISWFTFSVLFDLVFWVIIPHPWHVSFNELYIKHQPWLILCYLCTVLAPFITLLY